MAISSSKGSATDVKIEEEVDGKSSDIVDALKASGHSTCEYSNGLISAVRLESIPGARGVHVEVVHVLDLRTARFGKSGLAMRAALLESVNREYETVLHDVGLGDCIERRDLKIPFRTVSLLVLRGTKGKSVSLVHPTRTVYAVTRNVKPKMDLSWLTDSGRVVTAEEFALARRSDARSLLPELKHAVSQKKWSLLERSIKRGWLGVLALAASLVGIVSTAIILLGDTGSSLPSVLIVVVSLLSGLWLLTSSKGNLRGFENSISDENTTLTMLGDSTRIHQSIEANEDNLRILGDISFVVSPLMATLANAIEVGNLNESVNAACSILDECVRLAPLKPQTLNSHRPGDEGLSRFLGLFDSLGVDVEEEELALSYVALTAHTISHLTFQDMIHHVGTLNYALYNAGALRPDIKDIVDDKINKRAMRRTVDAIDRSLAAEADGPSIDYQPKPPAAGKAESEDVSNAEELDQELLDDMLNSSIVAKRPANPSVDEIPVITAKTLDESTPEEANPTGADIVAASNANKDSVEIVQTSLFESEEGRTSGS
ncbi:MAG: hypothetical protein ACXABV_05410 [Candidatus Thorarchaeota archaeon]